MCEACLDEWEEISVPELGFGTRVTVRGERDRWRAPTAKRLRRMGPRRLPAASQVL